MPKQDKTVDELTSESKEVVRKIRFLIDAHHETVPGLAKGVGVMPETIQDVLDGQSLPSGALIRRIADRFSLPIDFFTTEVSFDMKSKQKVRSTRAAKTANPRRSSSPSAQGKKKSPSVGAQDGALLQQALIELLIQKGVISADEWNARIRLVDRKSGQRN
ncbi:MAG: hypothetical protein CMJ95_06290 [Planctomycetes bacterium]|nr:hypothetical protein [Planctomycetota bacterium]